ncbi:hypothetical protein B9Z19DRAFT_1152331 [Tuber borchii]|uniref:UBA domain-containing protein n=1 Tax=Tuber borchii TaxID=42251 RepID=A0A2T6ZJZ7_TUBBO|nr:hypothetical protein B9Z19DRAFT_1152331 [Tuber borchii]
MPNAGVVPSQPLPDILSYDDDRHPWWPDISEAGFSNSNDGLDSSEYNNIWSLHSDPLGSNGFDQLRSICPGHSTLLLERALHDADGDLARAINIVLYEDQEAQRQYQERLQQGKQLSEIPQAAGGGNFQGFATGTLQGLEGYGSDLEVFNPQPSIPSTKEKKPFPQTPPSVLHSTNLPSSALVPSSSFHQDRCSGASITPAFPSKTFSSVPDSTLELTISPNPRLTQGFSAEAESHLGLRHVPLTGRPEVTYVQKDPTPPARSRKGCWFVSSHPFWGGF